MSCFTGFSKTYLFLVNVILTGLGGLIAGASTYAVVKSSSAQWLTILGIVMGCFICIMGLVGLMGISCDSRCCLTLYLNMLIPSILVEVGLGIAILVKPTLVTTYWDKTVTASNGEISANVSKFVKTNIMYIGIAILVCAGLQLITAIFSWYLVHAFKRKRVKDSSNPTSIIIQQVMPSDGSPKSKGKSRRSSAVDAIRDKYSRKKGDDPGYNYSDDDDIELSSASRSRPY